MNPPAASIGEVAVSAPARHPRGLATLFFTEMWERFSYYGMRGLLVLFMTHTVREGGLGIPDKTATAIYGLYTASVYLASLPGGWIADRLLGAQRSVWYGGIIIAAGHFTLAVPDSHTFFLGLVLIVIGTGLLKPNISAIVGGLYPEGGSRRDAGFSIFYMGINLGAFLGPFICGTLGQWFHVLPDGTHYFLWHLGFAAAGVGMVLGLVQYHFTRRHLGEAGLHPGNTKPVGVVGRTVGMGIAAALVLVIALAFFGVVRIDPVVVAGYAQSVIIGAAVLYFAGVFVFGRLDGDEKRRVALIVILFMTSALFWAGFEQAGSFFSLFADRHTIRTAGWLGSLWGKPDWEIPASWFQSINPIFIITLAPVMAGVWVRLGRRNLDPSIPVKFGLGLIFLALGFVVMMGAAVLVAAGHKVWPTWLISIYLIHTFGELCLSPVGLSSVTKLAPTRLTGQMLGTWFVASSLGSLLAGRIAGEFSEDHLQSWPSLCWPMIILPGLAGVLLLLFARPIKGLMRGVK